MTRGRPRTAKTDPTGTHITALLDNDTKQQWDNYCDNIDITGSQLLRRLIKAELTNQVWKEKLNGS